MIREKIDATYKLFVHKIFPPPQPWIIEDRVELYYNPTQLVPLSIGQITDDDNFFQNSTNHQNLKQFFTDFYAQFFHELPKDWPSFTQEEWSRNATGLMTHVELGLYNYYNISAIIKNKNKEVDKANLRIILCELGKFRSFL